MGYHDHRGHVAQDKEEMKDTTQDLKEPEAMELCEDGCCGDLCQCEGDCDGQ